jgi:hypothetical protein
MIQESNLSQTSLLHSFLVVNYFEREMNKNQTVHEWLYYTSKKIMTLQQIFGGRNLEWKKYTVIITLTED